MRANVWRRAVFPINGEMRSVLQISFVVLVTFNQGASQLVRPPLNSNSEVTDELLWIRLIASPNSPATDRVVIFTPLIAGRRTVSVVINSSILDFRSRLMPTSFKIACETHARIFF